MDLDWNKRGSFNMVEPALTIIILYVMYSVMLNKSVHLNTLHPLKTLASVTLKKDE